MRGGHSKARRRQVLSSFTVVQYISKWNSNPGKGRARYFGGPVFELPYTPQEWVALSGGKMGGRTH
jgi:hypothetical protein